jgi:L-serine dehydratase
VEITLSGSFAQTYKGHGTDRALLAGIGARIPADECLDAMRSVGDAMPEAVKETAMGGLASTPTGRRLQKQVFGE